MPIKPKTTYRSENDSGQTEIRKSFSVEREQIKVWKEEDDGTEVTHIEVPVSSPSEDRDGDEFSEQGLEHEAAQFRSGEVGMWLDHGLSTETNFPDYRVLEQIGGWKDARINDDEQLFATAALRPSSDDAQELETMLDEGVAPVGFSVGFIVEKSEEKEDSEHGQIFHKVDLLECSAVGIPSNPDAMVSDSAMATAKAVADAGGYDGEPERLARAITQEMRSSLAPNEQQNQTMQSKQSESEMKSALEMVETYLGVDGNSEDDPITEVIDWASETDEADADLLESVAEEALSSSDAESMSDLPTAEVMEFVSQTLESDEDGEGEEDEEEESGEPNDGKSGENDPPELRSQIRDALDEVLLDALTDEEALRSLISDEVRDALAEEEFEVDVTDSFVDELRSELFKDTGSGDGRSGPSPAGTISTYEPEEGDSEGSESGNESENKGGSGNASKPSPAFGGK